MNGRNIHQKDNELYQQVSDVERAMGSLSLCIDLAIHDKDQFLKEYGSRLYGILVGLKADVNIAAAKTIECLYK